MYGTALLVALSALGVDHTWRSTEDGQEEYVLQVEPVFLQALAEGQKITSELPATIDHVDRICIRIGSGDIKDLPRTAPAWPELKQPAESRATGQSSPDLPLSIYLNAKNDAYESYDLAHGWVPANEEESKYLIQIDPKFLRSLHEGDELYAAICPEAGSVRSFVISAGSKALPRKTAKPPVVTVAQLQMQGHASANSSNDPTLTDLTGGGSIYGGDAAAGSQAETGPIPRVNGASSAWDFSSAQNRGNKYGGLPAAEDSPGATLQPPTTSVLDVPQFGAGQSSQRKQSAGTNPSGSARSGTRPSAASAAGSRYAPQKPGTEPSPAHFGTPALPERQPSDDPQTRLASRTPTAHSAADDELPRRGSSFRSSTGEDEKKPEFPALPFTLSLFALFLSVGGNLYLGWTAAEFYSRYKLAVERLRSAAR